MQFSFEEKTWLYKVCFDYIDFVILWVDFCRQKKGHLIKLLPRWVAQIEQQTACLALQVHITWVHVFCLLHQIPKSHIQFYNENTNFKQQYNKVYH